MRDVPFQGEYEVSEQKRFLRCAINMARGLEKLAERAELFERDELCVLAGIMRDCAYKVRNRAVVEVRRLKRRELAGETGFGV